MIKTIGFVSLLLVATLGISQTIHKKPVKKKVEKKKVVAISYKNQVFPIIMANCLPCHTEDQMNPSMLYLDTYANMMAGGKHGKPIDPGKPDSSLLVEKLSNKPPFGDPMPLKRKTLFSQDTIQLISKWIEQGAKNN